MKTASLTWKFQATKAGNYSLSGWVAGPDDSAFDVTLNQQTVRVVLPKTGAYADFKKLNIGQLQDPRRPAFTRWSSRPLASSGNRSTCAKSRFNSTINFHSTRWKARRKSIARWRHQHGAFCALAAPDAAAPLSGMSKTRCLSCSTNLIALAFRLTLSGTLKASAFEILDCIERAAQMGFDGVEILHQQMSSEDNAYLQSLKQRAFRLGLDLMGFSTHQGFVSPDESVRQQNVDHTLGCIELAYALGIPTLRVNTGRWGTSGSFDELMANRGIEEPLPGHDEEEAFGWVIGSLEQCLSRAEKCGVVLGLENHWGFGA